MRNQMGGENRNTREQRVLDLKRRIEADRASLGPEAIRDANSFEPLEPSRSKKTERRKPKLFKAKVAAQVEPDRQLQTTPTPAPAKPVLIKCIVASCQVQTGANDLCDGCRSAFEIWQKCKKKGKPSPIMLNEDMTVCFQIIAKRIRDTAREKARELNKKRA